MGISGAELSRGNVPPELGSIAPGMPAFIGNLDKLRDIRVSLLDPTHPELGVLVTSESKPRGKRQPTQGKPISEEKIEILATDMELADRWLSGAFDRMYQNKSIEGERLVLFTRLEGADDVLKNIKARYGALNPTPGAASPSKPAL
jgi:hypothetical protein